MHGGERLEGQFFQPTVLTGVTMDMAMSCEETFGPGGRHQPLRDRGRGRADRERHALRARRRTSTRAISGARGGWRRALEYGIVGINTGFVSSEVAPFGGMKESGIGREGSSYGVDDWVELKYLAIGGIGEPI